MDAVVEADETGGLESPKTALKRRVKSSGSINGAHQIAHAQPPYHNASLAPSCNHFPTTAYHPTHALNET